MLTGQIINGRPSHACTPKHHGTTGYNASMIYLDNNATTRVDEQVRTAMEPWLGEHYGNPSSLHRFGQESRQAVELARHQVAELLGCAAGDIVFTSGGTEADNAAIMGVVDRWKGQPRRIVTSSVEHSAVREPLRWLSKRGIAVTEISVDARGALDMEALRNELAKGGVGLVSIMWANNESGVIFDIAAIGQKALANKALVPVDVNDDTVQGLTRNQRIQGCSGGRTARLVAFGRIEPPDANALRLTG